MFLAKPLRSQLFQTPPYANNKCCILHISFDGATILYTVNQMQRTAYLQ